MSDIHAYKLVIEHKDTITPDQVNVSIVNHVSSFVDRLIGLSFNVYGECDFGKVISARLVFENTKPINADKLGAVLNFKNDDMRIAEVFKVD